MKTSKALKKLTRIETLLADLTTRYSPTAPRVREAFQEAEGAVSRAKEALLFKADKTNRQSNTTASGEKKPAAKKAAVKAVSSKAAQKPEAVKKLVKRKAPVSAIAKTQPIAAGAAH